jgi:hypothetical protein
VPSLELLRRFAVIGGGVGGAAEAPRLEQELPGRQQVRAEAKPRRRSATGVDGEVDEGAAEYPGADVVSTAPAQQFPPSSTNKTSHDTRLTRGSS